jgi:hypothetical protein
MFNRRRRLFTKVSEDVERNSNDFFSRDSSDGVVDVPEYA